MAETRSFTEYVKKHFDNELFNALSEYLEDVDPSELSLRLNKVTDIGQIELYDTELQFVNVNDLPGSRIGFNVAMDATLIVYDSDIYHNDESESTHEWFTFRCEGDLACGLEDMTINEIEVYSSRDKKDRPLSDSLVPIIKKEKLDQEATDFLRKYYPEALKITQPGEKPISVDPDILVKNLGLTIQERHISEDASIFGQIYFSDSDTEMYNADIGQMVPVHVDAGTIVVDPEMYFLRNLGSVNNTIVHECVHWVEHRKVFELEKLFNSEAVGFSCEVTGGAVSKMARNATEHMERQANQLAPRIQMPKEPFRAKANEYIGQFMRDSNSKYTYEVMESVIIALQTDFAVSKLAVKLRLVELGFEEAIGTYTYLDGHYVKPHGFRKGSITVDQTFSLSAQDAAIERKLNPELHALTDNGDYLFIDNHYVYNAPLYVQIDESGELDLTDYARGHMDECCLVFDMKITSKVGEDYHTACFLNREQSDYTFELKYHNGYENAPQERQVAMRKKDQEEANEIRRQMTDDPVQCMELLLDWRSMDYTDLGNAIGRDPKTISRTVKGDTKPTIKTAALICFGLHLPPVISTKLMTVLGCSIENSMSSEDQWINEALHVKYPESMQAIKKYLKQYGVKI